MRTKKTYEETFEFFGDYLNWYNKNKDKIQNVSVSVGGIIEVKYEKRKKENK